MARVILSHIKPFAHVCIYIYIYVYIYDDLLILFKVLLLKKVCKNSYRA
jgi:hypothetical protein